VYLFIFLSYFINNSYLIINYIGNIFNKILKNHLTNEVSLTFNSVRRPNLRESEASLEDRTSMLLNFLESDKYLGYFWSSICEKKFHNYIKFSLFLFLCIFYFWLTIFAIHIIMWLIMMFTMHATIRKF